MSVASSCRDVVAPGASVRPTSSLHAPVKWRRGVLKRDRELMPPRCIFTSCGVFVGPLLPAMDEHLLLVQEMGRLLDPIDSQHVSVSASSACSGTSLPMPCGDAAVGGSLVCQSPASLHFPSSIGSWCLARNGIAELGDRDADRIELSMVQKRILRQYVNAGFGVYTSFGVFFVPVKHIEFCLIARHSRWTCARGCGHQWVQYARRLVVARFVQSFRGKVPRTCSYPPGLVMHMNQGNNQGAAWVALSRWRSVYSMILQDVLGESQRKTRQQK